uniref:Uncharacterized protein n=1 Tax=Rhizophora mucronata TaxID=61149 RepID=A0A2P2QNE0_RHIMU
MYARLSCHDPCCVGCFDLESKIIHYCANLNCLNEFHLCYPFYYFYCLDQTV